MNFKKFIGYEWDALAGILAAVTAIILELLHIVDEHVVLPILLALMGLLFINFMRHTARNEVTADQVERTELAVGKMQAALKLPDAIFSIYRKIPSFCPI